MATKKTSHPAKKTPTKKKSTKVSAAKKAPKTEGLASQVGLRPEEQPFMTFKLTKQTLYWLILGIVVIVFTVWIMQLQADIQSLFDEIDQASSLVN